MQVVKAAAKSESGWLFAVPVTDDIAPGYSQEITKPMDLGTVAKNLKSGAYYTLGMPSLAICEILIVSCSHSLVARKLCLDRCMGGLQLHGAVWCIYLSWIARRILPGRCRELKTLMFGVQAMCWLMWR